MADKAKNKSEKHLKTTAKDNTKNKLHRLSLQTSYHRSDLVKSLQELDDLGLVGRLDAGKTASVSHGIALSRGREFVKLSSSEGHVLHIVLLGQDADAAADSHSRAFVIPSDHDDSDAGLAAQRDGSGHLLSGRVQHADTADECQVRLDSERQRHNC